MNVGRHRPKTRTGCRSCKQRRVKCDETKPVCQNCTSRKIACLGYANQSHLSGSSSSRHSQSKNTGNYNTSHLYGYFFTHVAKLFSMYHGQQNPFASKLRTLADESTALSCALQSMSALLISSRSRDDKVLSSTALDLQNKSFAALKVALSDADLARSDSTFAAVIMLGLSETWDTARRNSTSFHHLLAAKQLLAERYTTAGIVALPPRYLIGMLVYWNTLVTLHTDTSNVESSEYSAAVSNSFAHEIIDTIDPILGLDPRIFAHAGRVLEATRQSEPDLDALTRIRHELLNPPVLLPGLLINVVGLLNAQCRLEHILLCKSNWTSSA